MCRFEAIDVCSFGSLASYYMDEMCNKLAVSYSYCLYIASEDMILCSLDACAGLYLLKFVIDDYLLVIVWKP